MERQTSLLAARGLTDERDRLLTADDPLSDLQKRCGGTLPGMIAVPELLEAVRHGRRMGLKIVRDFHAFDGEAMISGVVRVHPLGEDRGSGCELLIENWQSRAAPEAQTDDMTARLDEIDRACAEVIVRLDAHQRVQFVEASAADSAAFAETGKGVVGGLWSDHVILEGMSHRQPLHWRLLDGARCRLAGSRRDWRARLLPLGPANAAPRGFELLLVAESPLETGEFGVDRESAQANHTHLVGSALTPVLRQPISRIIANAETIRARLAGPLRAEYSEYAGNIAAAGQHLNGLLDDLADIEVVEAKDFSTEREPVDLGDAARRAAGILGVRARAKNIELALSLPNEARPAAGEFRRVLQILINLIGNAIAYSPDNSVVRVDLEAGSGGNTLALSVSDEGPGIEADQATRVFEKFERLGRDNDGGSGLGLYIASRLAEAMSGELEVANAGEEGAIFRLTLPVYEAG